jgi:hypothetical protein
MQGQVGDVVQVALVNNLAQEPKRLVLLHHPRVIAALHLQRDTTPELERKVRLVIKAARTFL